MWHLAAHRITYVTLLAHTEKHLGWDASVPLRSFERSTRSFRPDPWYCKYFISPLGVGRLTPDLRWGPHLGAMRSPSHLACTGASERASSVFLGAALGTSELMVRTDYL